MILIVEGKGTGIEFETYMNIHTLWERHHTASYKQKHPGATQSVGWIGWDKTQFETDLSDMSEGEILYIAAHGNGRTVGTFTAETLAEYLINHKIKETIGGIKLLACRSAMSSTPFNQILATELFTQSDERIELSVTGFPGDMTRTLAGKFRTIPDGISEEFDKVLQKDAKSFRPEWEATEKNKFIFKVSDQIPKDPEELLAIAKSVSVEYGNLGKKYSTIDQESRQSLEREVDGYLLNNKKTATHHV